MRVCRMAKLTALCVYALDYSVFILLIATSRMCVEPCARLNSANKKITRVRRTLQSTHIAEFVVSQSYAELCFFSCIPEIYILLQKSHYIHSTGLRCEAPSAFRNSQKNTRGRICASVNRTTVADLRRRHQPKIYITHTSHPNTHTHTPVECTRCK